MSESLDAAHQCPVCGWRLADLREIGRLGCPHDYQAFRNVLTTILQRSHGATRHVGKTPRRRPVTPQRLDRLALRAQLREAITREDYEEAARLRDRLRQEDALP